jgi:hypothetical protein
MNREKGITKEYKPLLEAFKLENGCVCASLLGSQIIKYIKKKHPSRSTE